MPPTSEKLHEFALRFWVKLEWRRQKNRGIWSHAEAMEVLEGEVIVQRVRNWRGRVQDATLNVFSALSITMEPPVSRPASRNSRQTGELHLDNGRCMAYVRAHPELHLQDCVHSWNSRRTRYDAHNRAEVRLLIFLEVLSPRHGADVIHEAARNIDLWHCHSGEQSPWRDSGHWCAPLEGVPAACGSPVKPSVQFSARKCESAQLVRPPFAATFGCAGVAFNAGLAVITMQVCHFAQICRLRRQRATAKQMASRLDRMAFSKASNLRQSRESFWSQRIIPSVRNRSLIREKA